MVPWVLLEASVPLFQVSPGLITWVSVLPSLMTMVALADVHTAAAPRTVLPGRGRRAHRSSVQVSIKHAAMERTGIEFRGW